MDFLKLVKDRYSCKKYDGRQVEKEKLDTILEAGRWAPTARNLQEQHIYVAQSPEALAKVDRITPCRYGAPTVLIVTYKKDATFTYPGGKYIGGPEDMAIVATHMMLAAKAEGVESCWLNNFDPDLSAKELDLPENEQLVMLLDLGYPAAGAGPLPNHASRKPLTETVTYC